MSTSIGITIANRYRFVRLAGRGGMGDVYLAKDCILGRQVAIKSISPALQGNPEVCQRIERECRLHASISPHPGIISLYDRIDENGNVYLILEYFAGESLSACLERLHKNGERLPLSIGGCGQNLGLAKPLSQGFVCTLKGSCFQVIL